MLWVAEVSGWMMVHEGRTKREALAAAKSMAGGASLLTTDVTERHLRPATEEDIEWYTSMGGAL